MSKESVEEKNQDEKKEETLEPPSKKMKTAEETTTNGNSDTIPLESVIQDSVFSKQQEFSKSYQNAQPYKHGLIPNLFQQEFIESVRDEIKQNSKVNFKETDLFRVYQSIDMANLHLPQNAELAKSMPSIMKLRNVLYSTQWRNFVETLTGLPHGTLTTQVDCACNCHAPGCHLLCHDDVITTRKVSYIIYLTENDWKPLEGGALELYDSHIGEENSHKQPNSSPSKLVPPLLNSMGFFVVEPGVSFHAVQEVYGERPRLSLQGWYHATEAPDNIEMATLNRLKQFKKDDNDDTDNKDTSSNKITNKISDFIPWSEQTNKNNNKSKALHKPLISKLLDADRDYLAQYIHETYLCKTSMEDIRQKFEEDSSVQLKNFFREEWINQVISAMKREDHADKPRILQQQQNTKDTTAKDDDIMEYYQWGVSDNWKLRGPSHKQRYLEYVGGDAAKDISMEATETSCSVGELLSHLKQRVLQSPAFGRYLHYVTSLGVPLGYRGQIRRFRPGLDYTVAHYGLLLDQSVLDATMCFVVSDKNNDNQDAAAATTNEEASNSATTAAATTTAKGAAANKIEDDDGEEEEMGEEEISEEDALWQSGDCGGFECYIEADGIDDDNDENDEKDGGEKEEKTPTSTTEREYTKQKKSSSNEAADEYNEDDDTELLSVSASNNTLSLVYRDPGTMRFVKYVGSRAPSSRWDITMEYEVEEEEEEGAEDEKVVEERQ